MRIRSIRPEFWSSEDVAAMTWDTRLVFIGLWSYVDDNGVGRDDERLVTAALFPLDRDFGESSVRVRGALTHLSERGQITRYAVAGKRYFHVSSWNKHQKIERASQGRYPLPTSENVEIGEPSPNAHRTLSEPSPPGEGEKGRRGEEEKHSSATPTARPKYTPAFQAFWVKYPRKVGKDAAWKAWERARKRVGPEAIMCGLERMIADPNLPDEQFVPHPSTWLGRGGWDDDPYPPRNGKPPPGAGGVKEIPFNGAGMAVQL